MNWIRIATGIMNDPSIHAVAEASGVSVPTTTGHVVGVLTSLPEHCRGGDLSKVTDGTLERWAQWTGKKGKFAAAFRAHLCSENGVIRAWEKHNGAALRKAETDAQRMREKRVKVARPSRDCSANVARQNANSMPNVAGNVTVRNETIRNVTTSPIGAVVSSEAPDPGATARRLTAAANKGITELFGEQPVPIRWDHPATAQVVADLHRAGVPTDDAERWLFDIARSRAPMDGKPPRTLRYYSAAVVDAWQAEQAHRDAATLSRPAATGTVITWDDIARLNTAADEVRDVA